MGQHLDHAHHGELVDGHQAVQPFGGHARTADAGEADAAADAVFGLQNHNVAPPTAARCGEAGNSRSDNDHIARLNRHKLVAANVSGAARWIVAPQQTACPETILPVVLS